MRTIMMASIARRVANYSSLCGMSPNGQSTSNSPLPYPTRMEKVKFGTRLERISGAAHNEIPSPLLVMILKLHKESPFKKDVFRAPGNQSSMKKLIHNLQNGRLMNIDNYSVHTIASVLKKFLCKLPSGIFGAQNESRLFEIIHWSNTEEKCKEIQRILFSLPIVSQHLLVLLFGTFRQIIDSDQSGMTSESLSISVAPSFFHSCISDGNKFAKVEDVQRFKIASSIMQFMIDNFGIHDLFGQNNYEYYSRVTRSVLNVEENWTFTFKYPPDLTEDTCLSVEKEWLNSEIRKWNLPNFHLYDDNFSREINPKAIQECTSSGTMCSSHHPNDSAISSRSHEDNDIENQNSHPRLSMSLEENLVKFYNQSNSESPPSIPTIMHHHSEEAYYNDENLDSTPIQLEDLKNVNHYAESTKSMSFLPIVHARQTQRMKTRSEWFLKPKENNCANQSYSSSQRSQQMNAAKVLIKKTSSKEKRAIRRTSSKKEKSSNNCNNNESSSSSSSSSCTSSTQSKNEQRNSTTLPNNFKKMVNDSDCTESDVRQINIKYTYKSKH